MLYSRLPSTQFNKCTFYITLTNRAFSKCESECDWLYPDVTKNMWACLTVRLQCKQKWHALQKKTWPKTWITLEIVEMKWTVSVDKPTFIEQITPYCVHKWSFKEWMSCWFLQLWNSILGVLGGNIACYCCYIANQTGCSGEAVLHILNR